MHKRKAAGFSLLEMVIALALVAVFVTAMLPVVRDRYDARRQAATASQIMAYSHAVDAYVQANSVALQASAGPTTPVAITPAQLTSLLPTGFSFTTPYGQTLTACVTEPTAGSLAPLVVTTGGRVLTDLQAIGVAMNITELGGDGGTLDHRNTSQLVSGTGFWRVAANTCGASPGLGHVADALFVRYSATTDDALHRHASGNPTLNTMSTALNMGGNDISNAGDITAKSLTLPQGETFKIGVGSMVSSSTNIGIHTPGALYIDNMTNAAGASIARVLNITGASGSTFTADALTARGDVTAAGAVFASNWLRTYGATGWYSQTYGGGWYMSDPTWIRAYNNKNIYTPGEIRGGTIHSTGNVVADGAIVVNALAAIGAGCATHGAIAQASNGTGEVVMCKSGRWTAMGGEVARVWHGVGTVANPNGWGRANNHGHEMIVTVRLDGENCGSTNNDFSAYATVNGFMVAQASDLNPSYHKQQTITFPVQSGATYQLYSSVYKCNTYAGIAEYY